MACRVWFYWITVAGSFLFLCRVSPFPPQGCYCCDCHSLEVRSITSRGTALTATQQKLKGLSNPQPRLAFFVVVCVFFPRWSPITSSERRRTDQLRLAGSAEHKVLTTLSKSFRRSANAAIPSFRITLFSVLSRLIWPCANSPFSVLSLW